ncbi:MAG TPA: MerR family transcriptional regulator [Thermodesulfobacteriota bacterium]|jgi:DNA-binding transcriptional MerR regulator|nr:MerR family transcriptional regulator [Thermodesulfobacteriota bacterium]
MRRLLKGRETEDSISRERLYYRIGEVSRITGLKPHILRYWESEFKVIRPHKGGSLQRLYRRKDLDLILKIKKLLYEEGFTIAGAKKKIRDLERLENKQLKLKFAEKGSDGEAQELLAALQEELKGIRKMLE